MDPRHLPNLITGLRFVLVLPLVWLLIEGHYAGALWLFAVMGVSDALDGFLAKHYGWNTTLGEYLDPLADKAMLVATYLTLGWLGLLPGWLVAAVILRDVVILTGALSYRLFIERLEISPTLLSKLNTGLQILLALVVIYDQFEPLPDWITAGLIVATFVTTVVSGLNYVIEWTRRARAGSRT